MIVSTLVAATVAAAQPQAVPPAPAQVDHQAMGHGDKKMACCENMAKGEGCACCKDKVDGAAKAGAAGSHDGHAGHDH